MLANRVLTLGILVTLAFAVAGFSQQARASANIIVVSHSDRRDALDYYWIFGEIQNTGDLPATNITITASFYDASDNFANSSNTAIAGSYGPEKSIVLLPGAKAPFNML